MSLPSPNLDDRRFQQFVDDAKRYIQQRAPEWTDHNVSDPGVTLVETVAHMADQIVYRLNRVPEKNHLAFLDLVGITLFPPSAARTDVTFWLSAPQEDAILVPVGTEVATLRTERDEAVVFTTTGDLTVVPCALGRLVVQHSGEAVTDRTTDLAEGKDLMCFAEAPAPGDCMLIGLTNAVPHCALALELDSRVDGVGVDPRQPPLVWEAWTEDGWQPCDVDRDGTGGLNRPGDIVLHVPGGHVLSRNGGHEAGWIRCRVTDPLPGQPFYTASPTIRSAEAYTIGGTTGTVHAETVYDEALGESTGLPGQRIRLEHAPVVADDPPVLLQTAADDGWQDWQVIPHFAGSRPDDHHITLDAATGEIAFGPAVREADGTLRQYGTVPPKGAVIRARRYRTGGGRAGNVARGAVQVLRTSIPYVSEVVNREAARGGVDGETVEEAKLRAPITLRAQERAVTLRDYEELARRAAPETARITCLEGRRTNTAPTPSASSSSPRPSPTPVAASASNNSSPATPSSAASPATSTNAASSAPASPSDRPTTRASPSSPPSTPSATSTPTAYAARPTTPSIATSTRSPAAPTAGAGPSGAPCRPARSSPSSSACPASSSSTRSSCTPPTPSPASAATPPTASTSKPPPWSSPTTTGSA